MNRNQNSHFSKNPQADIKRSRFKRNQSVKISFDAGKLIPFYVDEVLPGDTMSIDTSKLVRMQTLATPVMDNIYLDTYYFFVPNRLVWDHWKNFMGENTTAPWYPETTYQVPQVEAPLITEEPNPYYSWPVGSIADYMGVPVNVKVDSSLTPYTVNALPFRAYALIWNEWFRDENLQTPVDVPTTDSSIAGQYEFIEGVMVDQSGLESAVCGMTPLPVGKYRDYFTSCLPAPQKGPDVLLPLGQYAPVITRPDLVDFAFYEKTGDSASTLMGYNATGGASPKGSIVSTGGVTTGSLNVDTSAPFASNGDLFVPANLWTDLEQATAATINQLRLAFQIQKIYEADARGGSRYTEIIANHFGVTSPDSRMQRPEYLGGNRMLINVNQVVQNSESANTPQGTTTAYSLTVDNHSDFTHSFVEHGFLIGVCCVRYDHTYQQGLERFWSRKDRFDYYWPKLANIGEQPVLNKEIYLQGTVEDNNVFGYQEAWGDYRYKPNRVAGEMRSAYKASLDVWHLADDYAKLPTLSDEWIREEPKNIDRVLAVTSEVSNQFFGDFYIQNISTRPMPMFSVPGLIDHH